MKHEMRTVLPTDLPAHITAPEDCEFCNGNGVEDCDECFGFGYDDHDEDCDVCSGEGTVECAMCGGHTSEVREDVAARVNYARWRDFGRGVTAPVTFYVSSVWKEYQAERWPEDSGADRQISLFREEAA